MGLEKKALENYIVSCNAIQGMMMAHGFLSPATAKISAGKGPELMGGWNERCTDQRSNKEAAKTCLRSSISLLHTWPVQLYQFHQSVLYSIIAHTNIIIINVILFHVHYSHKLKKILKIASYCGEQ